jgi:ribosomal protein L4
VLLTIEEADAALSFRNLPGVAVLTVHNAGVADIIGAASLLVSQTAMPILVERAQTGGSGDSDSDSISADADTESEEGSE